MTISLESLRTQVRERCGQENNPDILDSTLDTWINASAAELYGRLTDLFQDYYTIPAVEVTVTTDGYIPLPDDFFKLLAVKRSFNDEWIPLKRNNHKNPTRVVSNYTEIPRYALMRDRIDLLPKPAAPGTYEIHYIPMYEDMVDDDDTMSNLQNWHEYVVVDVCIKCLAKGEDDPSIFMAQKASLIDSIERAAQNRDAADVQPIADVYRWI